MDSEYFIPVIVSEGTEGCKCVELVVVKVGRGLVEVFDDGVNEILAFDWQ